MTLRSLLVFDVVFLSSIARTRVMSFLLDDLSLSAVAGWTIYHRTVRWWSFRSPVAYLLLAGVARYIQELSVDGSLLNLMLGGAFVAFTAMSIASANRLIPLRSQLDPLPDWVAFEESLLVDSAQNKPTPNN